MRSAVFASTILNGIGSIAPQALGLIVLSGEDFGRFSVAYLMFALGSSVTFSVLCDPWVIVYGTQQGDRNVFAVSLAGLSVLGGIAGGGVVLIALGDTLVASMAIGCVALATYRVGARYFHVHARRWSRVVLVDALSIAGFVLGGGAAVLCSLSPLVVVLVAWAVSSLFGCFLGPLPLGAVARGVTWAPRNWSTVRPLLMDSLAMDVSAVGTPFLLLPVLELQGFGVYRAVSNMSSPVRILLAPLRPLIVGSPARLMTRKFVIGVLGLGLVVAGGIWLAIWMLSHFTVWQGVLFELGPFGGAVAVYVLGTVLLSVYPLVVRSQRRSRALLIGRSTQTATGIAFPVIGFLIWGLSGAIWMFAGASLLSGILWLALARSSGAKGQGSGKVVGREV